MAAAIVPTPKPSAVASFVVQEASAVSDSPEARGSLELVSRGWRGTGSSYRRYWGIS